MGSYLFELTGRLSEQNHVYEAFNVDRPELVLQVHLEYLNAGARTISTNTFGANETYLAQLGEPGRVEQINRQGVKLARGAIASFAEGSGR
jgi:homocysteine S-methyltransferase